MEQEDFESKLAVLCERMAAAMKPGMAEEVQKEMAAFCTTLTELGYAQDATLLKEANVATAALTCTPPNTRIAREIRGHLTERMKRNQSIRGAIGNGSPPTLVIIGLGVLFYVAIPACAAIQSLLLEKDKFLGLDAMMVELVAFAGALGSIVSIMVRIDQFSRIKNCDRAVLFFTGFFKPVIGASFALFVWAALESGLLPLEEIEPEKSMFFYAALAFVAGFSERFAKDVALRTEALALGNGTPAPNPQDLAPAPPNAPPGQPRNLEVIIQSTGTLLLDWKAPASGSGGPARAYTVERREQATGGAFSDWHAIATAHETLIDLSSEPRGQTLEYRVTATNNTGSSVPSNTVEVGL